MNLPANLEKILFQTVKMMKTLMLALIVIRSIAEKDILTGVLVDIVEQWRQTEIENFCCRDTNKALDNYFEGHKCITESEGFKMVCLSKPVLDTALSVFNHFRGESIKNIDNKSYRFAGYKQYIFPYLIILEKVFEK